MLAVLNVSIKTKFKLRIQDALTMANPKEARNVTQKDSNAEFNNKLSMADRKRTGFSSFWDQELFSCGFVRTIYHELR